MKLLAAALSIALPAAHAVEAGNKAPQKPLMLDFSGVRAALAHYVIPAPKSGAPQRAPITRAITKLTDAGSGSLREALANSVDGDVIDLSKLRGHMLLSSPLEPTATVTIKGPGRDQLTLDSAGHGRVLQSAHGLTLSNVTLTNGTVVSSPLTPPIGGCLIVSGYLVLQNATVTNCHAVATGPNPSFGGAIAVVGTPGTAILKYDTITNSSATSAVEAVGGGLFAYGAADVLSSTISGNSVIQANGTTETNIAAGGGVVALDDLLHVVNSTVSGNSATASGGFYYNPVTMITTPEIGTAAGGGVFANYAYVDSSTVNGNTITANGFALGGGGIVGNNSTVVLSSFSQNSVSSTLNSAAGGGLLNAGSLEITQSSFTANQVSSACAGCSVFAGGVGSYSNGTLDITASTISGNSLATTGATATPAGGGVGVKYATAPPPAVASATLTNSTISGNTLTSAAGQSNGGGIWIGGNLTLNNSTVAFNTSDGVGGGITASYNSTTPFTNTLYSSIIANNSAGLDASTADAFSFGSQVIAGSHDLVMAAGANITLPGGTLSSDPMLKPLAFNGGPTQTLALDPASPAIDTGLSPVSLLFDQRGPGYPRVVGLFADIGAYELDADRIFYSGFEFPQLQ